MNTYDTNDKYGYLVNKDILLHRKWFKEFIRLHGIKVIYRPVKSGCKYTTYSELDTNFGAPSIEGCIFDEHPTQQTLKKIGWISELQENSSLIHVRYDLPDIQQGCLFIIPSGLDNGNGRMFRVVKLTTGIVFPASITCEIVPEYEDTYIKEIHDHSISSFNLLNEVE